MKSLKLYFLIVILIFSISPKELIAKNIIQSQDSTSWGNIAVDLIYIKSKNGVLTLRFKYNNFGKKEEKINFYYADFYIIDETNQKKYFALTDSDDNYLAGPVSDDYKGGMCEFSIEPDSSKGAWVKFPVPTDHPETISISIPGVFPFEAIRISK